MSSLRPGDAARSPKPRSGPLGRLVARLEAEIAAATPPPPRRRAARTEAPAPPPGATSFLSALMDLRGSVDVDRALGREVPAGAPEERAAEARAIRTRMRARLSTIARGAADTRLTGLPGVPSFSGSSMAAALRVADVIGGEGHELTVRAIERATRALWAPVTTAIGRRAARAQAEIDAVFTEEAEALASLGARPSYVIALDALLDRVTEVGVAPLLDRPAELLSRRFAVCLEAAVLDLAGVAPGALDATIGAWARPGGFVATQLDYGERYLRGLVEHRVRRALALVDACCVVAPSDARGDVESVAARSTGEPRDS